MGSEALKNSDCVGVRGQENYQDRNLSKEKDSLGVNDHYEVFEPCRQVPICVDYMFTNARTVDGPDLVVVNSNIKAKVIVQHEQHLFILHVHIVMVGDSVNSHKVIHEVMNVVISIIHSVIGNTVLKGEPVTGVMQVVLMDIDEINVDLNVVISSANTIVLDYVNLIVLNATN